MFFSALLFALPVAYAAQAPAFEPPAQGPTDASPDYVGPSNGSLPKPTIVAGKQFDRFIQVWLENTDFATANSSATFQALAKQGILLDQSYAVTHPSEPNYIAAAGGDFFGMWDDAFYAIPKNISTIVDLLEAKNISWAAYEEDMPSDGYTGFNYSSTNYLNTSAPNYPYYVRKHNPLIIYDSIATVPSRAARIRNFNDFATDVNASAIPQWVFVTPNMVNDAHDTDINFLSKWLEFWFVPLLNNTNFNDGKTLILLTFDENESYTVPNQIFSILLGGAVPKAMRGTKDSTFYTHYSSLSTVEANWGLGSLGRGDTNKTLANVYSIVANVTGYKNVNVTKIPHTNETGIYPGALNPAMYVPYTAPNTSAVGAGGGSVFLGPGLDTNLTVANAPSPVNLTAQGSTVPGNLPTPTSPAGASPPSAKPSASGAAVGRTEAMVAGRASLFAALLGVVMAVV